MFGLSKNHIIGVILVLLVSIFYTDIKSAVEKYLDKLPETATTKTGDSGEILFTKETLARYNGENEGGEIYLSILGLVYDVTRGKKFYGKDCSYTFFAGRDASKSFITGEFEEFTPDSDDVLQLKPSELLSLQNWKGFYDKEYIYKGKLIGRFYDETGAKTPYSIVVDQTLKEAGDVKAEEERLKEIFPPCNIEWSEKTGTKVWCSSQSGGKERGWIGVPRKYFTVGTTDYRCACVQEDKLDSPQIEQYENCDPKSDTCYYKVD